MKDNLETWKKWTLVYIERINDKNMSEYTGENFYSLGYRGKNHQLVLLRDGEIVARGVKAITTQIEFLRQFYGV